MNLQTKKERLEYFANSVIENPLYRENLANIFSRLRLSKEQVIEAYVRYDMDIFAYENEIYEPIDLRAALYLHYLLPGSWHQDRQRTILSFLKKTKPNSIADMGFGAPTKYVKEYVLAHKKSLLLVDLYESAFQFTRSVLNTQKLQWNQYVSFQKLDMNTHEFPQKYTCYIFQDSLEHVKNATAYLKKIVASSPLGTLFIFSLPIGTKIPSHSIEWKKPTDAISWLSDCGIIIQHYKTIRPNPAIDLFAEQLHKNISDLIIYGFSETKRKSTVSKKRIPLAICERNPKRMSILPKKPILHFQSMKLPRKPFNQPGSPTNRIAF